MPRAPPREETNPTTANLNLAGWAEEFVGSTRPYGLITAGPLNRRGLKGTALIQYNKPFVCLLPNRY
jgi:hypothetical protein